MGTRSLVVFENEVGEEICVVYRQYDGYPEGRGKELVEFLHGKRRVNGFGNTDVDQANGIGDLVAQWIAYEKVEKGNGPFHVGNVYVYPAGERDFMEEFIYTVSPDEDGFKVTCRDTYTHENVPLDNLW